MSDIISFNRNLGRCLYNLNIHSSGIRLQNASPNNWMINEDSSYSMVMWVYPISIINPVSGFAYIGRSGDYNRFYMTGLPNLAFWIVGPSGAGSGWIDAKASVRPGKWNMIVLHMAGKNLDNYDFFVNTHESSNKEVRGNNLTGDVNLIAGIQSLNNGMNGYISMFSIIDRLTTEQERIQLLNLNGVLPGTLKRDAICYFLFNNKNGRAVPNYGHDQNISTSLLNQFNEVNTGMHDQAENRSWCESYTLSPVIN